MLNCMLQVVNCKYAMSISQSIYRTYKLTFLSLYSILVSIGKHSDAYLTD